MSEEEYRGYYSNLDNVATINWDYESNPSEATSHCSIHGNFCSKCIKVVWKKSWNPINILSSSEIKNEIRECFLACFDLKLLLNYHNLKEIYSQSRSEIDILQFNVVEVKEEFLKILKERNIPEFAKIKLKVKDIRNQIEISQTSNEVNKFLTRLRVENMDHKQFKDIIEDLDEQVSYSPENNRDIIMINEETRIYSEVDKRVREIMQKMETEKKEYWNNIKKDDKKKIEEEKKAFQPQESTDKTPSTTSNSPPE